MHRLLGCASPAPGLQAVLPARAAVADAVQRLLVPAATPLPLYRQYDKAWRALAEANALQASDSTDTSSHVPSPACGLGLLPGSLPPARCRSGPHRALQDEAAAFDPAQDDVNTRAIIGMFQVGSRAALRCSR